MKRERKFQYLSFCPRCAYKGDSDIEDICFFCNIKRIPTDMSLDEFKTIPNKEAWHDKMLTEVISKRPEFDYAAMKASFDAQKRRAELEFGKPKEIRCPKCGHGDFQMVPRRWGLISGFFTNKVDRVCVKCKTRF